MSTSPEETIVLFNKKAMGELKKENYKHVTFYLNQALMSLKSLRHSAHKNKLWAITFNNLGCYNKRIGNLGQALDYLYKAVDFEAFIPEEVGNIAGTHLNICTILSQMQEHEKALRHAQRSFQVLKNAVHTHPHLMESLLSSYHNMAQEYEFLGMHKEALETYKQAITFGFKKLRSFTPALRALKKSYNLLAAKRKFRSVDLHKTENRRIPDIRRHRKDMSTPAKSRFSQYGLDQSSNFSNHTRIDMDQIFSSSSSRQRVLSAVGHTRKTIINVNLHREQEKNAATLIQAWWKGVRLRKKMFEGKINREIVRAQEKANEALRHVELLKKVKKDKCLKEKPIVFKNTRKRNIYPARELAAAYRIQAWWRMIRCKRKFKKRLANLNVITKTIKRWASRQDKFHTDT